MHIAPRLITAAVAGGLLIACGGSDGTTPDGQRVAALASRLDALEKRLAAVEQASEPVDRLRNDAASLDRRVSSLESSLREVAARPVPTPHASPQLTSPPDSGTVPARPPRGAAAGNNPMRLDRTQRRAELRALSDEFRSRLSDLRTQPGGVENSDKTREILEWYREQRRAIMRGEGRTDQ